MTNLQALRGFNRWYLFHQASRAGLGDGEKAHHVGSNTVVNSKHSNYSATE